jgi:uncharacterized membrane protein
VGVDPATLGRTVLAAAVPIGLALVFGLSLRRGRRPLIERIARVGDPDLAPDLCRYTRMLTAAWCAYFCVAALAAAAIGGRGSWWHSGVLVGVGAALLFVGEHRLRPRLFPGRRFPTLAQQLRDTWAVWHP